MPSIVEFKSRFFRDLDAIQNAEERAAKKALSKFGAFVRKRARSSIRKRKATSQPGQPPTNRTGLLRNLILFAYEPDEKSVVIGPAILPSAKQKDGAHILEHGGTVPGNGREIWITREPGRDATGKFVTQGRTKITIDGVMTYKPRPYMRPAFEAELPQAAPMFKDMIK